MALTGAQFAAKVATLGPRMERNLDGAVGRASLVLKQSVQANLRGAIGPELRMSGVNRRRTKGTGGTPVNVTFDVRRYGGRPTSLLKMVGPAHLIERDTAPHVILARGVGRVQGRRTKAARLAAKQELYTALFTGQGRHHPGTTGKHPFEKGIQRAAPVAQRILRTAGVKAFGEVFG